MDDTYVSLLVLVVKGDRKTIRTDLTMPQEPVVYLGTVALRCIADPETLREIADAFLLAADVKESHRLAHSLPEVA